MGDKVLCALCLLSGNIVVCYPKDDDCFKCPECGAEIWPKDEDLDYVKQFKKRVFQNIGVNNNQEPINDTYRSCSLPEGVPIKGGEKKSGKRKKKKASLRALRESLYFQT